MQHLKPEIQIDGQLLIALALMLLLLPLKWVLAVILAVLVHEMFHAAAVYLLSGRIYSLRFGLGGARMQLDALPPGKELAVALAGPLGSAALMLLAPVLPRLAICGLVHCIYNLLPIFPLDGGRILSSLITFLFPGTRGEKLFAVLQWVFRLAAVGVCIYLGLHWSILPTVAIVLLLKRKRTV